MIRFGSLLKWLVLICAGQTFPGYAQNTVVIPKAANISTSSDGFNLAEYKGKIVYLDFWASWCAPCKQSFPWMTAMQSKYGTQGFVVVAVNLDQDPNKASQFLAHNEPAFIIKYDPQAKLAEHYNVKSMPSSFLLDRNGHVIANHSGFHLSELLIYEAELRNALKQQTGNTH